MTARRRQRFTWRRLVGIGVALVTVAAAWVLLAPPVLGGSVSYVMPSGTSMEPEVETGDLVLVREADAYRVGDVVAYRSAGLERVVLHRIVAVEGGRYLFRGDNNSWLDPERPEGAQLLGKLWFLLPGADRFLRLGSPLTVALLTVAAALLIFGGAGGAKQLRRRRARRAQAEGARPRSQALSRAAGPLIVLSTLVLIASLALAGLAFSRPLSASVTTSASYEQSGTFAYSALASPGPVYAGGWVDTGEPVFLRLIDRLDVRFTYRLQSQAPRQIQGVAALAAELSEANGWRHTLELQPQTAFEGDQVTLRGSLPLDQVRALQREFEAATGVVNGSYTLALVPVVRLDGGLAGAVLDTTFSPRLQFSLDELRLKPQLPEPGTTPTADGEPLADPLAPTEAGSVELHSTAPATLPLPKLRLETATARRASLLGTGASLLGLLLAGALLLRGRRADEPARIKARYGQWLIPVARSDRRSYHEVIEVTGIEALVRLAERYDRMILHEASDLGHSYRLADEGILYFYLVGNAATGRLPALPVPPQPQPAPPAEPARREDSPDPRRRSPAVA